MGREATSDAAAGELPALWVRGMAWYGVAWRGVATARSMTLWVGKFIFAPKALRQGAQSS